MALFKEVTSTRDDSKITINMDSICFIQRFADATTVYFGKDHVVHVKETPDEILMLKAL